jgi:hypothetical protein
LLLSGVSRKVLAVMDLGNIKTVQRLLRVVSTVLSFDSSL